MIKIAIFDLDGTLLYTLEDLKNSTNYALEYFSFPKRTIEEVRSFIGNGVMNLIKRAVPSGTDKDTIQKVYKVFKEHYTIHCNDNTHAFPGIIDMLKELKDNGIKTGIVSNKNDEAVKRLADIYFKGLIDIAAGHKEGMEVKPNPDLVNYIIKESNIDKGACVYIGDSDVDYYTAKNAGVKSILVSWGFRDKSTLEVLENADIIDSVEVLKKRLLGD